MASDKVINKWNVNIAVLDDVQQRFETGDYKTEQEVFGFLLMENNLVTACVYEDADECYKDYYFYNLTPEKYTSVIVQHIFVLEQQSEEVAYANKEKLKDWLMTQYAVITLLGRIEENVGKCSLIFEQDIQQETMYDNSVIDLLLERKINLLPQIDVDAYLEKRKESYYDDIYCVIYENGEDNEVFIDKRTYNIIKKRDLLNMNGTISSGLVFFSSIVNKPLYQLKSENSDKIVEIKKWWKDTKVLLHDINKRKFFIEKSYNENRFYENTYQKYKTLFQL